MSQDTFERLLGRLITDESFRRCAAKRCLERLCRFEGYPLTASELSLAATLDLAVFERLASQLDPRMLRASRRFVEREGRCGQCRDPQLCPLGSTCPEARANLSYGEGGEEA